MFELATCTALSIILELATNDYLKINENIIYSSLLQLLLFVSEEDTKLQSRVGFKF